MSIQSVGNNSYEPSIKVLVVDDHFLVGEMVVRSLSLLRGFEAMAVADLDGAIALIEENGRFDVILLDYDLPGQDSFLVLNQLLAANLGGVALFSGVAKRSVVSRALELGATGFIPKTTHLKTFQHAISLIASGENYVPFDYMRGLGFDDRTALYFTDVEKAVATRLCAGLTNKEIAREIDLTDVAVKMQVRALFGKLGVNSRTKVALEYQRIGLLD
jgi:two-component system nitrate/nitrite response regulator NarL